MRPQRIAPSFRQKLWGSTALEAWFPNPTEKTGEVWYHFEGSPILVKFLFTTEKLSVQVHPDDVYAGANEDSLGKTEMWHILRAESGATVALGFKQPISPQRLRESAVSGEIMELLNWVPAHASDTFFVPPGTVHALGEGLALVEIQQYSDVTYRLYDYGRDRPLHLEQSMDVAYGGPHPGASAADGAVIASCDYFTVEKFEWRERFEYRPDGERFHLLIVTGGRGTIDGQPYQPGECWHIPAASEPFAIIPAERTEILRTHVGRPD
jgi:mannose-6-phosphate isomerase